MNSEWEVFTDWITGLSLGIEFPNPTLMSGDVRFLMNLDLLIFRVVVVRWKLLD